MPLPRKSMLQNWLFLLLAFVLGGSSCPTGVPNQQSNPQSQAEPPIQFSLPLASDNMQHYFFDQDDGENGSCRAYNGSTACTGFESAYDNHRGTDFSAQTGTRVFAAAAGKIFKKVDGVDDGDMTTDEGNYIVIDHGQGFRTFYLHLQKGTLVNTSEGLPVTCGEDLGAVGLSGKTMGSHLHFGAHFGANEGVEKGTPFDPYDGFPYWKEHNQSDIRTTFWASMDAQGRPLRTCGDTPSECAACGFPCARVPFPRPIQLSGLSICTLCEIYDNGCP